MIRWIGCGLGAALACASSVSVAHAQSADRLDNLSIEELANVGVTSVTGRAQPVGEAPASVFVITADDIDRAGFRTIPGALRLAPNLQVARIGGSDYAITSRGFNQESGTANKLLVLVDGRIIYTPLYSGVFWDEQNPVMEDLDRIEVVGGPGGAQWGANAVNGVINIVSKDAHETTGLLATAGSGNSAKTFSVRYGSRLGESSAFRVYGTGLQRGSGRNEWQNLQGGFRYDWSDARDSLTFQGDIYQGGADNISATVAKPKIEGGNVLARWSRRFDGDASLKVQASVDRANRDGTSGIRADLDTAEIDVQSNFSLAARHTIMLGGDFRVTKDGFWPGPGTVSLLPPTKTLNNYSVYAQDTVKVTDALDFILGVKLEHNDYTGLEYLPSARLSWRLASNQLAWAAVSRTVRTPARLDRELYLPGVLAGGPDFESETLVAYEAGYRAQPTTNLWFSLSAFYNDYDELRTLEATTPTTYPLVIRNGMEGQTYGLEAWGSYAATNWWRLNWGVSYLNKSLKLDADSRDVPGTGYAGNDPHYQITLRSLMDFGPRTKFDLALRAIDDLPDPAVPAYAAVDARLSFQLSKALDLSVAGYNLLDESHVEFINPSRPVSPTARSFFITARWRH